MTGWSSWTGWPSQKGALGAVSPAPPPTTVAPGPPLPQFAPPQPDPPAPRRFGVAYPADVPSPDAVAPIAPPAGPVGGDGTPPAPPVQIVISNIQATPGSGAQQIRFCVITWTTDVACSGYVQWGLNTTYGNLEGAQGPATTHQVRLDGLGQGALYHFRIVASIDQGNGGLGVSADQTFGTASAEVTP